MEILKRKEAFKRACAVFGDWRTWSRSQHLAYGLIRGVPYASMERCSNDNPLAWHPAYALAKLGAWPDGRVTQEALAEVERLVVWVKKEPRGKRPRPDKRADEAAAP